MQRCGRVPICKPLRCENATESEKKSTPNLDKLRRVLFWDTSFDKIDPIAIGWDKNKRAVIKRVLERGNTTEIDEITSFYGEKTISNEIKAIKESHLSSFKRNILEFDLK